MPIVRSLDAIFLGVILWLLPCIAGAQSDDFPSGTLERQTLPTARALVYEFNDVQISRVLSWLRRINVQPPVPVDGTVSGWVWAQAPRSGWWRWSDYRVEGQLNSPLLDIDRFSIRNAQLRLGFHQGIWNVGQARGQIESRDGPESFGGRNTRRQLGQANLTAQLPMSTNGMAHFAGTLDQVSIGELLATLGVTQNAPTGIAQGDFRIDTQLANLSEPLRWVASGAISATEVTYGDVANLKLQSQWQLADAALTLMQSRITVAGQSIALSGKLALVQPFAWNLQLPHQTIQLSESLYSSLHVSVSDNIPLGTLNGTLVSTGQLTPWRAEYAVAFAQGQLNWLRNSWQDSSAKLRLNSQGLYVDALAAHLAGGALSGSGQFSATSDDPVSAVIHYQQLDLSRLQAPVELPSLVGVVSGSATIAADRNQLSNFDALNLDIQGTGAGVRIDQWGLGNVNYGLKKRSGQSRIEIDLGDADPKQRWQVTGPLVTDIADPGGKSAWNFDLHARARELDLRLDQLLELLDVELELPVPLEFVLATGKLRFQGDTLRGLEETEFDFSQLTVLNRDRVPYSIGSLQGRTTPAFIEIANSQWRIGQGQITAAATWHFLSSQPVVADQADLPASSPASSPASLPANPHGDQRDGPEDGPEDKSEDKIQLTIRSLDVQTLVQWIPQVMLEGVLHSGGVGGTMDADVDVHRTLETGSEQASVLAGWQGSLALTLNQVQWGTQKIGSISAEGQLDPDQWRAQTTGNLLSAPMTGELTMQIAPAPNWSVRGVVGRLNWLGVETGGLIGLWQSRDKAVKWRGVSNLRSEFAWVKHGEISGFVEADVPQLAYQGRTIIRQLRVAGQFEDERWRIRSFQGIVGGGRVDVSGAYNLATGAIDDLKVSLQRMELAEAVQLIDPEMSFDLSGRVDLRARVSVGREVAIHGTLRLSDSVLSGLPVSEAHTDFEVSSTSDWSLVRVHAANIRGHAFGGRLHGQVQARLSSRRSVDMRVRIERGQVEQLSAWMGTSSVVGNGKFDATLSLGAPRLQTARDFRGLLELDFEDTASRTLPVTGQLARFVPILGLSSTEFERGRLVGNISQGDLRISSLALWGQQVSVLGSGNVGLVSGRLDMQLVVRLGGGLSQQLAANYLTKLLATTAPPVELVLQINRLISNRAIFLSVRGTTGQPAIQLQTGRIIEQALLRSLLEQAVGLPGVLAVSNSNGAPAAISGR